MDNNRPETHMTYDSFLSDVKKHLGKPEYNKWGAGSFNGKDNYQYIANLNGRNKIDVVLEIIKSDDVPIDLFRKPHRYAHHLNSSQVVCYEFFRHLLDNDMSKALETMGLPYENLIGMTAQFEKVFGDKEGTNFDFYISYNGNQVFVEVKYTEPGFGICEYDDNHKKKFKDIYKDRILKCPYIKEELKCSIDFPQMRKFYQLFRNTLRAEKDSDYVVFIFPKRNTTVLSQFENFCTNYLSQEGLLHIKSVFWEDLKDYMSDSFRKKFFFYIDD